MNPKYRYPLTIFFASFILIIGGMAVKIMHWQGPAFSGTMFGAGMLVQAFSVLWLIAVILKSGKKG
jgi:hypothetical protein